jgi:hypothetical protein
MKTSGSKKQYKAVLIWSMPNNTLNYDHTIDVALLFTLRLPGGVVLV